MASASAVECTATVAMPSSARALNAQRDLTPVGDQDFVEHSYLGQSAIGSSAIGGTSLLPNAHCLSPFSLIR